MSRLRLFKQAQQNAEIFTLTDSRKLFFNQFGSPNGYPVIHYHGHGGCRMEGVLFDSAAKQYGFRLIVHSRPGWEQSSKDNNFTFKSHANDVYELAKYLNINNKFGVTGWSGGGPFVTSTCYYLGNQYDCISFGGLMAAFAPLSPETYKTLSLRDRIFARLSQKYSDPIYKTSIKLLRYFLMNYPERFWKTMNFWPKHDKEILDSIDDAQDILNEMMQNSLVQLDGILAELKFQIDPNWGFDANDIKDDIKMFIFHGLTDNAVPVGIIKELESKLKNYDATYIEQGHLFPMSPEYADIMFQKFSTVADCKQ
eukprot:47009_1